MRTSPISSLLLLSLAVSAIAWGGLDARFRDADGFAATSACWPIAIVAAALLLASATRRGWTRTGAWTALLIMGQAAALQLWSIGPVVDYAAVSLTDEGGLRGLPLAVLGAQALLVALGAWPHLGPWMRWLAAFGWLRSAALVAFTMVTAAAFFTDYASLATKVAFGTALTGLQLGNVAVIGASLGDDRLRAIGGWCERNLGAPDTDPRPESREPLPWVPALAVTAVTALLCSVVYQNHPHVPDEVVYLIHGEYFARGLLTLPAPPVPAAFDIDLMMLDGDRWFCPVPPGWPAALAVGAFLGLPWLVNPVLTGVCVLLAHLLLRELLPRATARLALWLLCASPWFLFMGMSFMPHPFPMAAALLAALGVARTQRGGPAGWCCVGGAAIGAVALVRPLEGLVLAGLLGSWAIGIGGQRVRPAALLGLVIGAVAIGAIALPYNQALTGNATEFPIMKYIDTVYGAGRNDLGFGENRGLGWGGLDPFPGHDLKDAAINAQFNLFATQAELHGWAIGSLLLLAAGLLARRPERTERRMLVAIAAVAGAHTFYWFAGGPDFGARYWYFVLLPALVLSARSVDRLGPLLHTDPALGRARLLTVIGALALAGAVTFVPWRITDKYHHYRGMRPDVRALAERHHFGRSLVLVQGKRAPDYASAAIYNPLDLEAPRPIYAWDKDDEVRAAVLAHYHDRPVWIVAGPTVTGGAFEVVAGPLAAADAAQGYRR